MWIRRRPSGTATNRIRRASAFVCNIRAPASAWAAIDRRKRFCIGRSTRTQSECGYAENSPRGRRGWSRRASGLREGGDGSKAQGIQNERSSAALAGWPAGFGGGARYRIRRSPRRAWRRSGCNRSFGVARRIRARRRGTIPTETRMDPGLAIDCRGLGAGLSVFSRPCRVVGRPPIANGMRFDFRIVNRVRHGMAGTKERSCTKVIIPLNLRFGAWILRCTGIKAKIAGSGDTSYCGHWPVHGRTITGNRFPWRRQGAGKGWWLPRLGVEQRREPIVTLVYRSPRLITSHSVSRRKRGMISAYASSSILTFMRGIHMSYI